MNQHRTHPAGFTLIELLVSIAIALLLILGVNEVFRISSETAGQGQALSTINRDNRAIQNTLTEDFRNLDPVSSDATPTADGPCFIIDSRVVAAFRNARDKAGAADPSDPLHDPKVFANSYPRAGYWNPALINYRSHRVDRLGFFARGLFNRQTVSSGATSFVSPTTGSEAYIWYGHANLPNPSNAYFGPGDPSPANTSNQVASDFFLCREAILLVPNPFDPNFLRPYGGGNGVALAPLGYGSPSNDGTYAVQDSRYDIGQSSIQFFSNLLSTYAAGLPNIPYDPSRPNSPKWWFPLLVSDPRNPYKTPWRFNADPFLTKPAGYTGAKVTPDAMAKASPCLVRGCSQFIVEFAGNFYTKDVNGIMTNAFTPDKDGTLDFSVDFDPSGRPVPNSRHIRWYGFPRDTNGDGIIDYRDVMPLRELLRGAQKADRTPVDDVESVDNLPPPQSTPYTGALPTPNFDYKAVFANPTGVNNTYTAAWGPTSNLPFPKMIRITVAIDDPNGRLGDAQVFEYVFDVQP
ncbi:MAG: hypothetical protein JWN51_3132 [Phycisphaerales bacterium]|nr:hypothetical protein [Phycisphaerales bacterium]